MVCLYTVNGLPKIDLPTWHACIITLSVLCAGVRWSGKHDERGAIAIIRGG